jgi:hypothetical protein
MPSAHLPLATLLPLEPDNEEEEYQSAPDLSRGIQRPTPAYHGGILGSNPTTTPKTTASGTSPRPPPEGIAAGEGFGLA